MTVNEEPPARHILSGQKVWLRPVEPADAGALAAWLNDAEIAHTTWVRAPTSTALEERRVAELIEQHGRERYQFIVCRLSDGHPIGTAGLQRIDLVNGSAAFDIAIGEQAAWGHGYGTDALELLLDFAFGELRLVRVWLLVYAFNERARHVYEKAGLKVEGTFRQAYYHRGRHHDVHEMAILRSEWEALDRPRSWERDASDG